jgi:hypothetical protein
MMDLYHPIAVSTSERFAVAVRELPLHAAAKNMKFDIYTIIYSITHGLLTR